MKILYLLQKENTKTIFFTTRIFIFFNLIQWRIQATAVLADKGYVSEAIFEAIRRMGAEVVIPNKSNAVAPRQVDYYLY
ncbi:MAG: hypothetical protein ACK5T0_01705, partial [Vampirovibrionales bacterium]